MQNTYVNFISDKDFISCIDYLYEGYRIAYTNKDLKTFIKNKIDPVKAIADCAFLGLTMGEYIQREIIRQADRAVSNRIGLFHEKLIGTLQGYHQLPIGSGFDVQSDNQAIGVEVKNKHNTVKGSDQITIFKGLLAAINDKENPIQEGYYVRIADTRSRIEPWTLKHKGKVYEDERIFIASADQFYWKLTGEKDAFKQVIEALPTAMVDYLSKAGRSLSVGTQPQSETPLTDDYSLMNDEEQLQALIQENFKHYLGFESPVE